MAEPAKKVAQQAEERLDKVAEAVRKKFDKINKSRFVDGKFPDGRFADQVDKGIDRGRADAKRKEQGGSVG